MRRTDSPGSEGARLTSWSGWCAVPHIQPGLKREPAEAVSYHDRHRSNGRARLLPSVRVVGLGRSLAPPLCTVTGSARTPGKVRRSTKPGESEQVRVADHGLQNPLQSNTQDPSPKDLRRFRLCKGVASPSHICVQPSFHRCDSLSGFSYQGNRRGMSYPALTGGYTPAPAISPARNWTASLRAFAASATAS